MQRTVSDVIVQAVVDEDVSHVFGVIGDAQNSFSDAIGSRTLAVAESNRFSPRSGVACGL